MRFLVIDNYDSFVYNIAQALGSLGIRADVARNDALSVEQIRRAAPDAIVISPGPGSPGNPRDFGVCGSVIRELGESTPILGVCLGHQGIIGELGGRIARARRVRHGKTSPVSHSGDALFEGVPSPFAATRYHSLVGESASIPGSLEVIARADDDGEVMAVRHRTRPLVGVQFHPESVMTRDGPRILSNFAHEVAARR